MNCQDIKAALKAGKYNDIFAEIYGEGQAEAQIERYGKLLDIHDKKYGGENVMIFSTSGRTELAGNHTDHNLGRVLAASIQLDTIAVVTPTNDTIIEVLSEGYPPSIVDISHLKPVKEEENTADAILRGIAAVMSEKGYPVGGFKASTTSTVLKGSGLSSSAALEVLVGTIINELYCDNKFTTTEIAQNGQYAENVFFNKPCGLMDQVACANGGIVMIDFKDPKKPVIEPVSYNFRKKGYTLFVVDTGGNHADLTPEYAAVPAEMKGAAQVMGAAVCRERRETDLLAAFKEVREKKGDRALLRGIHFMRENERVAAMEKSLQADDVQAYLDGVNASGNSSYKYLQNVYASSHPEEQGLSLALALTEGFLNGDGDAGRGACRVHGGGFAGTIQVYVPNGKADDYKDFIESFFGDGAATVLKIRQRPTSRII